MPASQHATVGFRIRRAREIRNFTQEQLAAALDVSVVTINRWEHAKAYPRPEMRARLCAALNLSSDALFGVPTTRDLMEDDAGAILPLAPTATFERRDVSEGTLTLTPLSQSLVTEDSPFWHVRPARQVELSDPLLKQGRRPVEQYFERSIVPPARKALCEALREGRGGLALFGPAMVGKTRLALEVLRREAPDHLLVVWPRHAFPLTTLTTFQGRSVALLLDDLHELTTRQDSGRITAAVQRLLMLAESLIVVVTSRSGLDEAATHQHYDGLIESLGLCAMRMQPMAASERETARFFAFARQLAEREPTRRLSLDIFDGTPGSVLLGLERRTTQLRSPHFPSAAKGILKSLALLRAASVYNFPESRVRRVACAVFELPPERWSDALDYLIGAGWVNLDEGDQRGESSLFVPSDAYLDICLIESGVYPRSNRRIASDFPKLVAALSQAPVDSETLFALSRTIFFDRTGMATKWNELGLECAQRGLAPLDTHCDPVLWARGQYVLGLGYYKRWLGNAAENVRRAIAAFEAAQTVLTRAAYPLEWAAIERGRALAYFEGQIEPTDELAEYAIACLRSALEVYTRAAAPYDWATLHCDLGTAYDHRTHGERAANVDRAIAYYRLAARVLTREAYPGAWALLMRNLGETYGARIRGDCRANQERGIAYLRAVLDDAIRERYPYDWARAHFLLATIYRNRLNGAHTENLRSAISHYEASIEVYTPGEFDHDREQTLAALAEAREHLNGR